MSGEGQAHPEVGESRPKKQEVKTPTRGTLSWAPTLTPRPKVPRPATCRQAPHAGGREPLLGGTWVTAAQCWLGNLLARRGSHQQSGCRLLWGLFHAAGLGANQPGLLPASVTSQLNGRGPPATPTWRNDWDGGGIAPPQAAEGGWGGTSLYPTTTGR